MAHNGSLISIPGREVIVQGWYQGGISVFDWTDVSKPFEIAYYDRGPLDPERMVRGGSWSVYWYNGLIVSSEIARGLDIYELLPSGLGPARISESRKALAAAEKAPGSAKRQALSRLAADLQNDASSAADAAKVRALIEAIQELEKL